MMSPRFLALAFLALAAPCALAHDGELVSVQVIDRDGAGTLSEAYSPRDDRPYVVGTPGHRYSVRLANRSSERVLVVLSVDGVNAITGETAATEQSGYVLAPYQQFEIKGWRKSDSDIAEFVFTSVPDSYAARTGRPTHVGVIGVAAFREKPARVIVQPQVAQSRGRADANGMAAEADGMGATSDTLAKSAPTPSSAPSLGTGHGTRVWSPVARTQFERASSEPQERLSIGYDTRAKLVARGILPRSRPRLPEAFPADPGSGYVPDPN